MKDNLYVIDEKTYVRHIDDEVHLYGLLRQLAFLAGKVKEPEDVTHLLDTAKRYGEIAEEKYEAWNIPGRYCVFGDKADLSGLMEKELCTLEVYQTDDAAADDTGCRDLEDLGSGFAAFFDTLADMAEKARSVADTLDDILDVGEDE